MLLPLNFLMAVKGSRKKKVLFLVAGPLRGGGLNGCATKEKSSYGH